MRLPPDDLNPLYDRVKALLRQQIENGALHANALVPSKEALAKSLGVSDMTVRRALIELTNEGWLKRIRGKGTFVAERTPSARPSGPTCVAIVCNSDLASLRGTLFYQRILQGMYEVAESQEVFLAVKKVAQPYAPFAEALRASEVAGVVALGGVDDKLLQLLKPKRIPCVLLDTAPLRGVPVFDEVNHFDETAAFQAVQELVQLGHERIGMLTVVKDAYFFRQRYDGYCRALEAAGIKPDPKLLCQTHPTSQAAYAVATRMLSQEKRCTALFCAIDEFAVGAMAAARDLGLVIPDDVSIAGFGDIGLFCVPALSSARIPMEQMGKAALETLLRRIREPGLPPQKIIFDAEWIARASTGALRFRSGTSSAV